MREFQLVRYFRTWWWLIAVFSIVGGIVFYTYVSSTQTYKAQITVAYLDPLAEEGLNPDGSKLNAAEITSPAVLTMMINGLLNENALRTEKSIDFIRRDITIEEVIPDDVKAIQAGAWQNGMEYKYYPTEYVITYETADEQEARRTIESLLDCYITYYTEKYVSIPQAPNSIHSIQGLDSDYLEYAEVLEKFINENRLYLIDANERWPDFRSSTTGYSFHDLYSEYDFLYSTYIPKLYSTILSDQVTRNAELLTYKYQYLTEQNEQRIQSSREFIQNTEGLIDAFLEKNRDTMQYHWAPEEEGSGDETAATDGGSQSAYGERYVVGQVYAFDDARSAQGDSTYDKLLAQYLRAQTLIVEMETQNAYYETYLETFRGLQGESGAACFPEIEEQIAWLIQRLTVLDEQNKQTAAEHMQALGPQSIEMTSSANVFQTKNVELYLLLALFIFFFVGFVCVVLLGRGLDFIHYMIYVDHMTDLPNRVSCDAQIELYAGSPMPLDFTCMTVSLDNIAEINRALGRDGGNQVMRIFAGMLRDVIPESGFVGYNGSMRFLCLVPECNSNRSTYYQTLFSKSVEEFNKGDVGVCVKYHICAETTSAQKPMSIFELVSLAFGRQATDEANDDVYSAAAP